MGEHTQPKVQLTVRVDEHGKVSVMGPFENKPLCYKMIEVALQVVNNFKPQENKIVVPSFIPPPMKGEN